MIGYLCGTARGHDLVVCGGVGYRVATPTPLTDGETVELNVVTIVREDAFELFGFPTAAEEQLFRALIKAPRFGPKLALTLIGTLGAAAVARAVSDDDAKTLASCKGIGAKVAATLCTSVTLSEGLLASFDHSPALAAAADPAADRDPIASALVNLGYPGADADRVAAQTRAAHPDLDDEGRLLRVALSSMVPS